MNAPSFRVANLAKCYRPAPATPALRDATLALPPASRTALAGRTGSGKTTLALCLAGLLEPTSGTIWKNEHLLWPGKGGPNPSVQMVRQDSPLALNPRWTVSELIGEPLRFRRPALRSGREADAIAMALSVGLPEHCLRLRPHQLSGGQRQRVAIARALSVDGLELLILDEPLRGLDPESRESIVELLLTVQQSRRFSMLSITHDLSCVHRLAQRMAVMSGGTVVEAAPCKDFFTSPRHPASRALIEAEE